MLSPSAPVVEKENEGMSIVGIMHLTKERHRVTGRTQHSVVSKWCLEQKSDIKCQKKTLTVEDVRLLEPFVAANGRRMVDGLRDKECRLQLRLCRNGECCGQLARY